MNTFLDLVFTRRVIKIQKQIKEALTSISSKRNTKNPRPRGTRITTDAIRDDSG
jgi:hypothetical protein